MQFPVQITIGHTQIPLHAITEVLGMFIGFRYFLFLRKKQQDIIEDSNRIWILIGAIFGSLVGSRLIGGLEDVPALLRAPNKLLYFYENKTVLGGFLLGVWGVELVKHCIAEKQASGDLFVFPMILALIIGRIGCFSMGVYEQTFGLPTTLPWGINLGDGIARHPVCIYEILFLVAIWLLLAQCKHKTTLQNGALFKIWMMAYLLFRFWLDFLKPHYTFSIGLSTIQITCCIGLLYYCPYWLKPSKLFTKHPSIK